MSTAEDCWPDTTVDGADGSSDVGSWVAVGGEATAAVDVSSF